MNRIWKMFAVGLLFIGFANLHADENSSKPDEKGKALGFKMKTLDGKEISLEKKYLGKVVLFVNVASQCGLTSQYEQLQALHAKYSGRGLAIVGVPCNQFGKQEPGTSSEIKNFCQENYGVKFDMLAKVDVNGAKACGLYRHLTGVDAKPVGKGKVSWNFEKFIVDREGHVVARIKPFVKPDDKSVIKIIESELGEK